MRLSLMIEYDAIKILHALAAVAATGPLLVALVVGPAQTLQH